MYRICLTVLSIFMHVSLTAMDQFEQNNLGSIIVIDVFDKNFRPGFNPKLFLREASLFEKKEMQGNPRLSPAYLEKNDFFAKNQKLFKEHVRLERVDRIISLLEQVPGLRGKGSLAENMWNVCCNNSVGFTISCPEDYKEPIVPLKSVVRVCLLLACKKNNRRFLCNYQQRYGAVSLLENIGDSNYEKMCGKIALKSAIRERECEDKRTYKKREYTEKINLQLQRLEELFSDEVIKDEDSYEDCNTQ